MNKSERLPLLKSQLRSRKHPTPIAWLAMQYDCSEKTIRRDIELLNNQQQLPCYIYQNHVHLDTHRMQQLEFDGYWLSADELQSLFALNITIEQLSKGALAQQLAPIKKRLLEILGDSFRAEDIVKKIKILEIAQRSINTKIFNQIVEAVGQNQRLQIDYWKRSDNSTDKREVSPIQLVRYKDNWYLDAFCHQSNAIRSFSVDVIQDCRSLYQKGLIPKKTELAEHFETSYGIFSGQATQIATLHFNSFISRWIQNESWHPDQILEKQPDGSLMMHLPYHHDIELIQDILKYGANVQVLSPPSLQSKITLQLEEALRHYRNE